MEKTKLIIVRHGQSLGNAKKIYLGHTDLDLSELGYHQARLTAEHLGDVKIDKVYSSDLLRAHNTAVPHAELRGLEVIDSKGLRELFLGDWENCVIEDLLANYEVEFLEGWVKDFGRFEMPNGESVPDCADRVYNTLLEIARENIGKTVLIASHAAAIRAVWCKILGLKSEEWNDHPFPTNASYSTLEFDGEKFIPTEYSNDSHFPADMVTKIE